MKRILIIGHSGFLGTKLVESLISKYEIIGLSKKIKNSKIQEIEKDLSKIVSKDFKNIFCVIHLAAITNPKFCEDFPDKCITTNVLGTQKVLELARKNNCKLIYASTSHVYGIPKKIPISEVTKTSANSIYSGSKLAGEILCESYAKQYDMDITIARIFSVYGPGGKNHYVLSNLMMQLKDSNIIELGNINSKRDFIFISDVIDAVEIILKNMKGFNTYNIGSGKSKSLLEICKIIEKLTNKKIIIKSNLKLKRKFDPSNIVSDSSKLKKLGWKPQISLNTGLKKILMD